MKVLQITLLGIMIPLLTWAQTSKSSLFDNSFRTDSITITGRVLNQTSQVTPTIEQTHCITHENIKTPVPLDSQGNFSVKVPAFNTTQLTMFYIAKGSDISIFAEPGEKITIISDWESNQVTFEGKYAKEHQQTYNYHKELDEKNFLYKYISPFEQIPHDQFLLKLRRFAFQNDSIQNAYLKKHPETTERAREAMRINNHNQLANTLMQRRYLLDKINMDSFSKAYMDYADSLFASLPRPYTLAGSEFLRDYLGYYSITQHKFLALTQAIVDYAIEKKKFSPTEAQRKDISLILKDTVFQSLSAEIQQELVGSEDFRKILLDYYTGGTLHRPMPAELKEIALTLNYYRYLQDNRIALSVSQADYYKQEVKTPALQKFVLDLQSKLLELENSPIDLTDCVKDATPFEECTTGEDVLSRLIAPHKGKIIYLDIWGTWCPPCKKEMQYAGNIKEAMKGKEVVFLYLAKNSPEMSWKNIIKENQLTGKQTEHYRLPSAQQNMIEKHLNIRHYPSYILIDREGKIIEREAPRPSSGSMLIECLNQQLSK